MKILYLDCGMGAAGDMLAGALLELLPNPQEFVDEMNGLGIPGVRIRRERAVRAGITGTHFRVEVRGQEEEPDRPPHGHGHSHSSPQELDELIYGLRLPTMVKLDIAAVYEELARAEAKVHGVPVADIHFHEVGAMDAVADITAVCLLLHRLAPDKIVASPVRVGYGTVKCAHGILPVPAPAAAALLSGIPTYAGELAGELCTPTGAALLRHFAGEFAPQPTLAAEAIGYGMGKKDFPQANCVRAILGSAAVPEDRAWELKCNLDDMTGEEIGFAIERLLDGGALDAFTTPVGMKKSRPGVLLTALCREADRERITVLLLKYTTTLGVRGTPCRRVTLERREETLATPYGPVRRKIGLGADTPREKYEYEDLARIARDQGQSLEWVKKKLGE